MTHTDGRKILFDRGCVLELVGFRREGGCRRWTQIKKEANSTTLLKLGLQIAAGYGFDVN